MAPSELNTAPSSLRLFLYRLAKRQQPTNNVNPQIIPTTYLGLGTDPAPGSVVGITLGTVLGVVLVIMLVWWALYQQGQGFIAEEVIVEDRHHHPRRRSRRYSDTEIREVRRPSPRRRSEIVEERVVEERIPVRAMSRAVSREEIIVEPRRRRPSTTRDEEEVIVYEESESTGPPARRSSGRRSSRRDSGGFSRVVDPNQYAGGDYPKRPASRRYS